jgi:TonB family protein
MRKTTFISSLNRRISLVLFIAFGLLALPSLAQESTPSTSPAAALPDDPRELLQLAASVNGLMGADLKPWHLKATFKLLDETGAVKDEGTFEEIWASTTKFKRTYIGKNFILTEYGTASGVFLRSGEVPLSEELVTYLYREAVDPLPGIYFRQDSPLELQQRKATNGTVLACVSQKIGERWTWCFDADRPILRFDMSDVENLHVIRNSFSTFQGHTISGDLQFVQNGKSVLSAHIESLEPLGIINEPDFAPSADAKSIILKKVNVSGAVMQGKLIQNPPPFYPPLAKSQGVQGTVVLKAIIGEDGRVHDVGVVSGPKILQQAAIDAVKQWRYKPFLLNGEAVEVETEINIVFSLGGR